MRRADALTKGESPETIGRGKGRSRRLGTV